LEQLFLFFVELNFPNVCNLVVLFNPHLEGGYINNILECCFLGQILVRRSPSPRCQLTSGMNLVAQMQLGKILENFKIMFDHVKHVVD
jgi:hypothetical protein